MSSQKSIIEFTMNNSNKGPKGNPAKRTFTETSLSTNPSSSVEDEVFHEPVESVTSQGPQLQLSVDSDTDLKQFISTLFKDYSTQIQSEFKCLKDMMSQTNAKVSSLEKDNNDLKKEVQGLKQTVAELTLLCNQNNQYSRKNSIRVFGIPEEEDPKLENCSTNIIRHLAKPGLPTLSPDDIEISHRIGRYSPSNTKPRAIIAKFVRRPVKDNLIRKRKYLKGSNIVIYDDLSPLNMELLNTLKKHSKIDQAWSNNGKILGKLHNGTIRSFTIGDNLSAL